MRKTTNDEGIGSRRLTDRQRELLSVITVGPDNIARFPAEPRIPDWKALKEVMVALGGTWKKSDGFAFAEDVDAAELVHHARTSGVIIDPRAADFFETPDALADLMVAALGPIDKFEKILEPSAGRGAIVKAIRRASPRTMITAIEALDENMKKLERTKIWTTDCILFQKDFLACHPDNLGEHDAVVMNPPFSKRQDIIHVTHAFSFLRKGGVLVAIMSAGVQFRDDKRAVGFRKLVANHAGAIEPLPENSFAASGTKVRTVFVRMVR